MSTWQYLFTLRNKIFFFFFNLSPVHPFLPPFSVVSPTPAPSLEPHPCSLLLSQLVCTVRPTREAPWWVTGPLSLALGGWDLGVVFPRDLAARRAGLTEGGKWGGGGGPRKLLDCFHLGGELAGVLEDIYLNWRGLEDGVVGE